MHNQDVSSDVRQIAHRFAATRPMRRGSLSVRLSNATSRGVDVVRTPGLTRAVHQRGPNRGQAELIASGFV